MQKFELFNAVFTLPLSHHDGQPAYLPFKIEEDGQGQQSNTLLEHSDESFTLADI